MKKLLITLFLCSGLFFHALLSQDQNDLVTQKAEAFQIEVDTFLQRGQIDKVLERMADISRLYQTAQQWENFFSQELKLAVQLIITGSYKEGEKKARNIAKESPRYLGRNSKIEAIAYNLIGFCLHRNEQYQDATYFFQKSNSILKPNYPEDPNIIDNLNSIGACFADRSELQYDSALTYYHEALRILKQQGNNGNESRVVPILNNIGNIYYLQGIADSALFYSRQAITTAENAPDINNTTKALNYRNYGTILEELNHEYDSAIYFYHKSLATDSLTLDNRAINYNKIGANYHSIGEYRKALTYYEKGLSIAESILEQDSVMLSFYLYLHNNIGATYYSINQPQKALLVHKQAERLYLKQNGSTPHSIIATIYNNIAGDYKALEQYDTTLSYYYKSLAINQELLKNKKIDNRKIIVNYINIGDTYLLKGNYDQAEEHFQKALIQLNKNQQPDLHYRGACYNHLGTVYQQRKNFDKALDYYTRALDDFDNIYLLNHINHPYRINCLNNIGHNYFLQGQHQTSLNQYQSILHNLDKNQDLLGNNYTNPSSIKFSHHTTILPVLHNKAIALEKTYEVGKKLPDLTAAAQTIRLCDALLDSLRRYAAEDKITLAKQAKPIYESAIRINHTLYEQTKDVRYIDKAFYYSEKGKGIILLSLMIDSQAKIGSTISKELLDQERELRLAITNTLDSLVAPTNRVIHEERLFELKSNHSQLIKQLEMQNPTYYNAKHNLIVKSISDIQNTLLDKEKAVISYFVGNEHLFFFVITQETQAFIKVSKPSNLQEQIYDFNHSISAYWSLDEGRHTIDSYQYYVQKYIDNATSLYKILFNPILERQSLPDRLILIPDEELNHLSFAALLTEEPADQRQFSKYPYLIQDYDISYTYSATILAEMESRQKPTSRDWLGFAPSFATSLALKYTVKEVDRIQKITGGTSFINDDATLKNFLEKFADYSIIHLATHAIIEDDSPSFSRILFSETLDSLQKDVLTIGDIYNIESAKDMVVLSACQTNSGSLLTGEGVTSLARAFTYSGAKNITATLWKVKEYPSYQIMTRYYELLAKKTTKDRALCRSQLDYLEGKITMDTDSPLLTNREKHPYFWAGYISIGDTSPLEVDSSIDVNGFYLVIVLVLIFCVWFFRNKIPFFKKEGPS